MRLIIFDLDGTLVEFNIPVERIKEILGVRESILEEIMRRNDGWECLRVLERYEMECASKSRIYPGVREFLSYLEERGIKTVLYTRNSIKSVRINLKRHNLTFDYIFTREDDIKPSPYPILHAMEDVGARKNEVVLIGDYYHDYLTAKNAEIEFWLYESEKAKEAMRKFRFQPDLKFKSYSYLIDVLERRLNGN